MTFANPGESWNSKTVISGCDQQICPGTFLSSWPFVRNRSKNYRLRTAEKWKAKEDKAEEFKKQKMQKNDDGQCNANWQTSSWSCHQPMTWASSSWQQWSSDETRERSDWQQSSAWSSSDQTRQRSEWRSSCSWQSPFSWQWRTSTSPTRTFTKAIHDDENNVCLWRATIFSSILPLVLCCLVLQWAIVIARFQSCEKPLVLMTVWLKANQSVAIHVTLFVCLVTKKGSRWDYPCNPHHLPDLFVRDDPR